MKAISRTIAGALFATGLASAQVQMGGRAAVNFSTLWGDGASEKEIPWSLGLTAGAAAKVAVNEKVNIVPELDVDWRRQKNDEYTWNTWAIELPVLARYNVMPQMYFEAGPRFALLLSSELEQDLDNYVETTNFSKIDALNLFEFGIDVGIGYSVTPVFDMSIRYGVGLTSIIDGKKFEAEDQAFKNMQIQVGGTYWFM
ncbi:Outer membrane protein beta-barrel domain-containing protein [Fibrobacter sp. UWB15]|jgi:hypothetical protein|uniref:porin family protein n=1 Tax=unclassified Fibrobacter TaxID=2634177 RepID=UPI0009137064|nr:MULTISPECIES: porin family protein [unclassified Fibrobacter]PWJ64221.1 outer membrane protein with beta-barrel domain [Fibrobacter sp. UWB6]SHG23914.1 Outer membrane protein beta-barrel domain-containing protein [Fibrobacter sp. UWB8]SMG28020.1 Outer membrane protein beta-barrel domain-containing protein [Fibrobacter sp. UWB15]